MAVYLKEFEATSQYNAYTASTEFITPNVSLCVNENEVHYNPYVAPPETRVVAKFNVTDTSSPISIGYNQYTSGFSEIEIDGLVQTAVTSAYTFSTTGEHTVKYTLTDPTSISESAFYNCRNMTNIYLPSSVTNIRNKALSSCVGLISLDIPSGVTSIGNQAFSSCTGLTSINIPSGVTKISDQLFDCCYSLKSIDIPDSVTSFGNNTFMYCSGLTSINIPSGVTRIPQYTFSNCTNLTSCIFKPDSKITSIGNSAFNGCTSLTSIDIPSGVTSIGNTVFQYCSSLTSIVCNATTAPTISSYTFRDIKTGGTLTVPSGSSGYDVWMGTGNYYLGKYNWTKVEQ